MKLWAVTIINPATGWFEIETHDNKKETTIANIVEFTWILRYPPPIYITVD